MAIKKKIYRSTGVTLGNFDGLHLGHRVLIKTLLNGCKKRDLTPVLYTFEPHPVKVLAPHSAPKLINTQKQKTELIKELKIKKIVYEKFNRTFARMSAENFFEKIILKKLKAKFIVVGYDFTFGKKREGNIETLERLCFKNGLDISVVTPQMKKNTLSSSSLIRKQIAGGNVREATDLLARNFFIDGQIISGHHRGAALGFHTANLKTDNELIPADGVYATRIQIGKKTYSSATNIGLNPTFDNDTRSIETHIFNFNKNIVGKKVRLYFVDKIRDEKKFKSMEELKTQIAKDIIKTKKILK